MPSNDFNGDPICILSMGDAIELVNMVNIISDHFDPDGWDVYNKLVRFVDENSN